MGEEERRNGKLGQSTKSKETEAGNGERNWEGVPVESKSRGKGMKGANKKNHYLF